MSSRNGHGPPAPSEFPPPVDSTGEFVKRELDSEDDRIDVGEGQLHRPRQDEIDVDGLGRVPTGVAGIVLVFGTTFRAGALMASILMCVSTLLCRFIPETLVGIFSHDPGVLAVGIVGLAIAGSLFWLASRTDHVTSGNVLEPDDVLAVEPQPAYEVRDS